MALQFRPIKSTAFEELQKDAGVILSKFDPTGATPIEDADILFTTSGGINITATPTDSDWGEDVDGAPNNTKELKNRDDYEVKVSFTALNVTEQSVKTTFGAFVETEDGGIRPSLDLKPSDFKDIYWVGKLTNGGFAACKIENALSTGGFGLQTTKKAKGQVSVELTGHYSIETPEQVPAVFYVADAS